MSDITYNKDTDCIRCGRKDITIGEQNTLWLYASGGYGDFIDPIDEPSRNTILCHYCAHKLLIWIGKRSKNWIWNFGTGSHLRPHTIAHKNPGITWWHYGWDNRRIRGLLSAMYMGFRMSLFYGLLESYKDFMDSRQEMIDQAKWWLDVVEKDKELGYAEYNKKTYLKAVRDFREAKQWKW